MQCTFSQGPLGGQTINVPAATAAVGQSANTYVMLYPWGLDINSSYLAGFVAVYQDSSPLPSYAGRITRYANSDSTGANWSYISPLPVEP